MMQNDPFEGMWGLRQDTACGFIEGGREGREEEMEWKRLLARLALVLIGLLLLLLLFLAFTGAPQEYLLAILFGMMVVPSVIYIFIWFAGLTKK
ncbi:MAG: hypothetical protein ACTTHL_09345 [Oribacterium sp.]